MGITRVFGKSENLPDTSSISSSGCMVVGNTVTFDIPEMLRSNLSASSLKEFRFALNDIQVDCELATVISNDPEVAGYAIFPAESLRIEKPFLTSGCPYAELGNGQIEINRRPFEPIGSIGRSWLINKAATDLFSELPLSKLPAPKCEQVPISTHEFLLCEQGCEALNVFVPPLEFSCQGCGGLELEFPQCFFSGNEIENSSIGRTGFGTHGELFPIVLSIDVAEEVSKRLRNKVAFAKIFFEDSPTARLIKELVADVRNCR